jgi:hypothetical protein
MHLGTGAPLCLHSIIRLWTTLDALIKFDLALGRPRSWLAILAGVSTAVLLGQVQLDPTAGKFSSGCILASELDG